MAYTQADLDAVRSAIARGERSVQIEGKRVEYRDVDQLMAAERFITAALQDDADTAAGRTRRRQVRLYQRGR